MNKNVYLCFIGALFFIIVLLADKNKKLRNELEVSAIIRKELKPSSVSIIKGGITIAIVPNINCEIDSVFLNKNDTIFALKENRDHIYDVHLSDNLKKQNYVVWVKYSECKHFE